MRQRSPYPQFGNWGPLAPVIVRAGVPRCGDLQLSPTRFAVVVREAGHCDARTLEPEGPCADRAGDPDPHRQRRAGGIRLAAESGPTSWSRIPSAMTNRALPIVQAT